MSKCKWCQNHFGKDDLSAGGYCDECNLKIRREITQNKDLLSELKEKASPELPADEKKKIAGETETVYNKLRYYKEKGVTFFRSDINQPRNEVYLALGMSLPAPVPVKRPKKDWIQAASLAACLVVSLGLISSPLWLKDRADLAAGAPAGDMMEGEMGGADMPLPGGEAGGAVPEMNGADEAGAAGESGGVEAEGSSSEGEASEGEASGGEEASGEGVQSEDGAADESSEAPQEASGAEGAASAE